MSRPRPHPVAAVAAEVSTWAEACATLAPRLPELEALETMLTFVIFAVQHPQDMERLLTEHARLTAENARLTAANASEAVQAKKWQAAVETVKREALALERRGLRVQVPA